MPLLQNFLDGPVLLSPNVCGALKAWILSLQIFPGLYLSSYAESHTPLWGITGPQSLIHTHYFHACRLFPNESHFSFTPSVLLLCVPITTHPI